MREGDDVSSEAGRGGERERRGGRCSCTHACLCSPIIRQPVNEATAKGSVPCFEGEETSADDEGEIRRVKGSTVQGEMDGEEVKGDTLYQGVPISQTSNECTHSLRLQFLARCLCQSLGDQELKGSKACRWE